jgi:hypothetical protein
MANKIEIKFSELDEFFEDEFKWDLSDNYDTQTEYWLGEIAGRFNEIYGWAGIDVDWDQRKLILNSSRFEGEEDIDLEDVEIYYNIFMGISDITKKMGLTSDWISRSYEGELHPFEEDAWVVHGLGGDDDVDYCSSYIDSVISALENYGKIKYYKKK